ncbi:MAG: SDR family oxidoreductase [Candidatus Eremiobacteraeota bacterium]|nr:SDR family oxidoreductase [Candidatus Eremiobacteraeota bacterium]
MGYWTESDIPSLRGRTAVVTGTGGLGFEAALALARAGATVILAGRNARKGEEAVARMVGARFELLDLASLRSVVEFAERLQGQRLDLLVNNAAVMTPPRRGVTEDGFELQLGTNYLGHYALTARLLPMLQGGRVVTLSSVAARRGRLNFEDLQSERRYDPMAAYGQSKLACLMFALELERRGLGVTSVAAHPGISRTELLYNGAGPRSLAGLIRRYLWFLFQPAAQGALPTLYAATVGKDGGYYGPDRFFEVRGYPAPARIPAAALDLEASRRLWEVSQELTGVRWG